MLDNQSVKAIIPALNEAETIGEVIRTLPSWIDQVIVVDNGSTDTTSAIAAGAGATVVRETTRGYGSACHAGVRAAGSADILLFLDGDLSDYPEEAELVVRPIAENRCDLVIGSRNNRGASRGSLSLPQRFGNRLACFLMLALWDVRYTDLGPFRAVRTSVLRRMHMTDRGYGWTIEMQIKAARAGDRIQEVPVRYRARRAGRSKVSGSIRGVIGASWKIMFTIMRYALSPPPTRDRT